MRPESDFNNYKETYQQEVQQSIAFSGLDVDFFTEVKARYLIEMAERNFSDPAALNVLDIGCGVGLTDRYLIPHFGAMHGVDIAEGLVEKAAEFNPTAQYQAYDGTRLPFEDNTFDIVFAICVMHHVPPAQWEAFTHEMRRVLKPGGIAAVFEHNPFNPLTRLAVNRCEFDAEAVLLRQSKTSALFAESGMTPKEKRFILFFPFRKAIFARLERAINWLPLGAQYYVAAQK